MKRLFAVLAAILMAGWAFADDEVMLWMMEDPTVTLVGGGKLNVSAMTDVKVPFFWYQRYKNTKFEIDWSKVSAEVNSPEQGEE